MPDVAAGTVLTAALMNGKTRKCVARGRRSTTSSIVTTTTDVGVLRLDNIPMVAGRSYLIQSCPLALDSTVSGDDIGARIRFSTNATPATTGSGVLPGSNIQLDQSDNTVPEPETVSVTYVPSSNQTVSLLLCLRRIAGTGNVTMIADGTNSLIELMVYDMGDDPGNTGVNI